MLTAELTRLNTDLLVILSSQIFRECGRSARFSPYIAGVHNAAQRHLTVAPVFLLTLSTSSDERLCNGTVSVCPSVCPVDRQQRCTAGGLAPAADIDRSVEVTVGHLPLPAHLPQYLT